MFQKSYRKNDTFIQDKKIKNIFEILVNYRMKNF